MVYPLYMFQSEIELVSTTVLNVGVDLNAQINMKLAHTAHLLTDKNNNKLLWATYSCIIIITEHGTQVLT